MNLMLESYLSKVGAELTHVDDCDFYPYVVNERVVGLAIFVLSNGNWQVHGISSPYRANKQETAAHLHLLLAHFMEEKNIATIFTARNSAVDSAWCKLVEKIGFREIARTPDFTVLSYGRETSWESKSLQSREPLSVQLAPLVG